MARERSAILAAIAGLGLTTLLAHAQESSYSSPDANAVVVPTYPSAVILTPKLPDLHPEEAYHYLPPSPLQGVHQIAEQITVKVRVGESWGSGIILSRAGDTYIVATNEHVTRHADSYQIETGDGQLYAATLLPDTQFGNNDLALLSFQSNQTYRLANLGHAAGLLVGDTLVAAGFPFSQAPQPQAVVNAQGLTLTEGRVALINRQVLDGGYSLAYTNSIAKGMSGGPVLNLAGEVVGVNGMHAFPLWGDPYVYQDGSRPCPAMHNLMEQSSWAIPIETLRALAPKNLKFQMAASPGGNPAYASAPIYPHRFLSVLNPEILALQQKAEVAQRCLSYP